eukprot:53846-Prymnesium_polylepis.1
MCAAWAVAAPCVRRVRVAVCTGRKSLCSFLCALLMAKLAVERSRPRVLEPRGPVPFTCER